MATTRERIEFVGRDRTGPAFDSIQRRIGGMRRSVLSLRGALAGIGIAGFAASVARMTQAADDLQKLSIRLGISVEALSRLSFAAARSGVSFQTLSLGLQRMTRRIAEAAQGTGEARTALRELGLSAQELARLGPEQQFLAIAEALSLVEGSSDRVRLAMRLFDSEGVALVQTMADGAAGIQQLGAEAERLGAVLTSETAAKAASANDALTSLKATFSGIGFELVDALGPALRGAASLMANVLVPAIRLAVAAGQTLVNAFRAIGASLKELFRGNFRAAGAALVRGFATAGNPVIAARERIAEAAQQAVLQSGTVRSPAATTSSIRAASLFDRERLREAQSRARASLELERLMKVAQGIVRDASKGRSGRDSSRLSVAEISLQRQVLAGVRRRPQEIVSPQLEAIKRLLEQLTRQRALEAAGAVAG